MSKNFENILSDFEAFIKTFPVSNDSVLYSFSFHFDSGDWLSLINRAVDNYPDIFFFKSANNQQTFIGVNSAITLQPNDAKSFKSVTKSFNHWKENFYNNWDKINKQTAPIIF